MERVLIEVRGTVQGVGFRPHVCLLATSLGLSGLARNRGAHLFIALGGDSAALRTFAATGLAGAARPLVHRMVPCTDGGLARGQAVAAALSLPHAPPAREHASCA